MKEVVCGLTYYIARTARRIFFFSRQRERKKRFTEEKKKKRKKEVKKKKVEVFEKRKLVTFPSTEAKGVC